MRFPAAAIEFASEPDYLTYGHHQIDDIYD